VGEMSIGEFARRSRLSAKALRLYDELGLLPPAHVDDLSGYRYYESVQLEKAQLIATLRHVGVPLATVKEWLALDPAEVAERVGAFWREAEANHASQRELVAVLVDRLTGRSTLMYEVATREMPRRSLLCLKRNVDQAGAWALGKEFIGIVRDERLPRLASREGAVFSIYWGEVSADSDGPLEWCKPVSDAEAGTLATQFPELTLRVEPAHREAYVDLGPSGQIEGVQWRLAAEALRAWAEDQGIDPNQLSLKPEDLGVRITYLASGPPSETSAPECDFAVPFATATSRTEPITRSLNEPAALGVFAAAAGHTALDGAGQGPGQERPSRAPPEADPVLPAHPLGNTGNPVRAHSADHRSLDDQAGQPRRTGERVRTAAGSARYREPADPQQIGRLGDVARPVRDRPARPEIRQPISGAIQGDHAKPGRGRRLVGEPCLQARARVIVEVEERLAVRPTVLGVAKLTPITQPQRAIL
jgi:DNA-binding transcriptional MerR regulator